MRVAKAVVSIVALIAAGSAYAQTTSNCMNMGGGMVHCDNMGTNGSTSSTNCTAMGSGMSNCTTMSMGQPQPAPPTPDMSRPQTGGTTLNFIGDLVARSQERSFQKKVDQMLAAGDCQGAANVASAKGRFAMSNEIRRSCAAKAIIGAAESSTAEQQRPSVFDLLCQGTETRVSKAGLQEVPYARAFRINLDSGRYCDGECTVTQPLTNVAPTRITFYDNIGPSGRGSEQWVNRENGELFAGSIGVNKTTMANARCERRPFTGFPQARF